MSRRRNRIPLRDFALQHSVERCQKRYGVGNPEAMQLAAEKIRRRDGVVCHTRRGESGHDDRSVWDVEIEGVVCRVVYDHGIREVLTVLPPGSIGCAKRKD